MIPVDLIVFSGLLFAALNIVDGKRIREWSVSEKEKN